MGEFQVSEYIDYALVHETVVSIPALEGLAVRGFVLSENRRECIIFTPVGERKP
jgi:hypothetical protein